MKTNKTISEWIDKLPEPQRTEAIQNTPKYIMTLDSPWITSVASALKSAFVFSSTIQGAKYWEDIIAELNEKHED